MLLKRTARIFFWITAGVLLASIPHSPAWSATAESKYYAAERCVRELKKSPQLQKYRDRWLRCIKAFLGVYRDDPHGPWAAAGLYQAGILYGELYQHSFLESDRREAIDLLDNVMRHFARSSYSERARLASDRLKGARVAQAEQQGVSKAEHLYKSARAQEQRLQESPELQKKRDQWLKSIGFFRQAFQADPAGQFAPAALYGLADNYAGLYKWSRNDLDRLQSEKTFRELITAFPQSPYAQKARARLESGFPPQESSATDAIAQVIQGAGEVVPPPNGPALPGSSPQLAMVEGLRFWSNPRYTRVVIDANTDTIFTHRELREDPSIGKPQRIFIDVQNSRLSQDLQKVVPINDNLLSDVRAGQYSSDTVRVVVDIKSSKTYKIFSLKNPYRIVLDVWGIDVAAPGSTESTAPVITERPPRKLPDSAIVKQLALGVRRIVIDPGHGGKDYGAPGAIKGVHEKHIVLEIARKLADRIRSELALEVILTRDSDTYLSLEERTAIANTQYADLFISIHTNASPNKEAHGLETFILNLATDDEAFLVAARENATSTKNISDLHSILKDLMQNAKVSESTRLASYVQQGTLLQVKKKNNGVRNKGVKKAPFYVLLGADPPSILIETGFISNHAECRRLIDSEYQDLLCRGIVDGIRRYIQEINPMALGGKAGLKNKEM
ncbi:MAG: AMIN domain-containing protein [Desulfobacteraceae bacterium]|nr:MAG: AMIN domain-containing protein [Desulfobacteraceae bacterium]